VIFFCLFSLYLKNITGNSESVNLNKIIKCVSNTIKIIQKYIYTNMCKYKQQYDSGVTYLQQQLIQKMVVAVAPEKTNSTFRRPAPSLAPN
jgi:hypothetical protein